MFGKQKQILFKLVQYRIFRFHSIILQCESPSNVVQLSFTYLPNALQLAMHLPNAVQLAMQLSFNYYV